MKQYKLISYLSTSLHMSPHLSRIVVVESHCVALPVDGANIVGQKGHGVPVQALSNGCCGKLQRNNHPKNYPDIHVHVLMGDEKEGRKK